MAKSSLGKAVSRVGASGGGRTYAKARPVNYYAVISLIVLLGLGSVVYSRWEHQRVISHAFPAKGSTGYVGIAVDVCGKMEPFLKPAAGTTNFLVVLHDNVIAVHPRTAADSGNNATVDALMLSTGQLSLTSTALSTPLTPGAKSITFTAGTVCAANTPDAGKKAYPNLGYWSSISQRVPTITNAPGNVVLSNHMLLTFSFLPKNVDPALPATITISQTFANAASATTTTVATTSTTAATTTTTTAPTTTTTTKK